MYNIITKYVTKDGEEHTTEEKAILHVSDSIHEVFDLVLKRFLKDQLGVHFHRTAQIELVEFFYTNRQIITEGLALEGDPHELYATDIIEKLVKGD